MPQEATPPTRPVRDSAEELVADATAREPMTSADAKSSATFERVVLGEQRYVLKHIDPRGDWISRWTGDYGPRVTTLWRTGLLDALPGHIVHVIEGLAQGRATRATAVMMRDVSQHLVSTKAPLPPDQHLRFLDHMAELHAHFWGWEDTLGLTPMDVRYTLLTRRMSRFEAERGRLAGVPALIPACWDDLDTKAPEAAATARRLAEDPWRLVAALAETPATFIHGDWKAGNLGSLPDGRTILLDWGLPGAGPPCVDLAWYLAVNCDLLPQSKEDAIESYRAALESHGVATSGWWDAQLDLSLLGAFVQTAWSKTHDLDELGWWAEHAAAAIRRLS